MATSFDLAGIYDYFKNRGYPNLIWKNIFDLLRDIRRLLFYIVGYINFNLLRRNLQGHIRSVNNDTKGVEIIEAYPNLRSPVSQIATVEQIRETIFADICSRIKHPVIIHRKLWEWVYIIRTLESLQCISPGKRGLGFGVGKERLVSLFAGAGCEIMATDAFPDQAIKAGWTDTNQYAMNIEELNEFELCPTAEFNKQVKYRHVDMRNIDSDLKEFDFLWSSCAFEHLGSIEDGFKFVEDSLSCLKVGGIAVHTTEINVSNKYSTKSNGDTVLYRYTDLIDLATRLSKKGYKISLNFQLGDDPINHFIIFDPMANRPNLKILVDHFVTTSFGLWIQS